MVCWFLGVMEGLHVVWGLLGCHGWGAGGRGEDVLESCGGAGSSPSRHFPEREQTSHYHKWVGAWIFCTLKVSR